MPNFQKKEESIEHKEDFVKKSGLYDFFTNLVNKKLEEHSKEEKDNKRLFDLELELIKHRKIVNRISKYNKSRLISFLTKIINIQSEIITILKDRKVN